MAQNYRRVPWWMLAIIIICALPVLAFPTMLSWSGTAISDHRVMLWMYPFYVLLASFLAWKCYGERTALTWILLALILLTHAAMWQLVLAPANA